MSKLNICAARRPGMTHAAYSRYARDNHARLVLGTEPVARHLSRYVQQHVFDAAYGALTSPVRFDSVSHITAQTLEDHAAVQRSEAYRTVIAPDEPRFADGATAQFSMTIERPLTLPVRGASPHRLLHYGKRREGTSAEALQAAWSDAHADVLATTPNVLRSVRRAVLNHVLPHDPSAATPFDAMGELGFLDRSDVPALCDYVAMMETRLQAHLDVERSYFLLCDAVPVRGDLY
jgi:hypothetical protein